MKQQDEHKLLDHAPFNDVPETEQRYREYWDLFEKYKNEKETHIRFFNKNGIQRNIYDYIKDSVDRMNEYRLRPEWKEDWQSNVFDPITRDKLIAILSMLASSRMKPEVTVKDLSIFTTSNTKQRASVYRDLLENSNRHNNDDDQLIWEMFTAMSEGTVFGYEGWARDTKEIEYVKDYNPDTGEKEMIQPSDNARLGRPESHRISPHHPDDTRKAVGHEGHGKGIQKIFIP